MGVAASKDMAICLVFFNPAKSKRMLMNYLYVVNRYKNEGVPLYTIELTFGDAAHEIADAIHVRSKSYMFHKERLCRLLEYHVPRKYTKLMFLDADVLFAGTEWYKGVSKLLDTNDVVQPFRYAHWLDLTYTTTTLTRETVLAMEGPMWNFKYHPGFAWAFRREWYKQVGFFDWAVSGSGDTLSAAHWLGMSFPKGFNSLPMALTNEYEKYCRLPRPRIACLETGEVYHLYHGARKNRQYSERHALLNVKTDIRKLVQTNWFGAYEWISPATWNPAFLDYFKNRNDDDLSEDVSVKISS